ncbi:MAG: hypothetical protein M3P30_04025 [Chloroflexota bacterium]|nr:hypothetical protein [Chloroflexota bacterium]
MPIFNRKPEKTVEDLCREFYDSSVFHRVVGSLDLTLALWDEMSDQLVRVDPSFSLVNRERFRSEMTALRLELFALAFSHSVRSEEKNIRQTAATREYLHANGHEDMVEAMTDYNTAVADSALDTATGERSRRARAGFLLGYRVRVYNKLAQRVHDAGVRDLEAYQDLARTIERYDTLGAWQRNMTHVRLSAALAKRLDYSPNSDGYFLIQAFIEGMYNGAKGAIKQVKIS